MPKSPVLRFIQYIKPVRKYYIGAILCGVYKFSVPVFNVYCFGQVIEALTAANLNSQERFDKILWTCGLALIVSLISPLFVYFRTIFSTKASLTIINNLRIDLFHHVQKLSHSYFAKNKVGSVASRIISDTATTQQFLTQVLISSAINLSTVLIVLIFLLFQNWLLGLLTIALVPIQMYFTIQFSKKLKANAKKIQKQSALLFGETNESLNNISVVKMFTAEEKELHRFTKSTDNIISTSLISAELQAKNQVVNSLATGISPLIVIVIGGYLALFTSYSISAGLLVTFVMMQTKVYDPIIVMTELLPAVAESRAAMERIFELLDTEPDVKNPPNAIRPHHFLGDIIFENVSFSYGSNEIIKSLSIKIEKNKTTAFVGASGSGKSTITYLIPRFYDIQNGAITINGYNITKVDLKYLRSNIGIVPQEPMLFSGTILNNIIYGRPEATREEAIEAAKLAYAEHFIENMPQGYDTLIGERGASLSGGQKQRIAIARAFLKNPPILILDEATSALDNESEAEVQKALNQLMQNRTTIVIAHRLSTIRNADKILVFDMGKLLESGTHQELLQANGKYASLATMHHTAYEPGI